MCTCSKLEPDEANERNKHSGITSQCCRSFSHAELRDDGGDVNWFHSAALSLHSHCNSSKWAASNRNISSDYAYPNNPNLPQPLSDLRSFPQGNKNCYTLRPAAGNASLYLIRASFFYANYDGLNDPPQFDLYLDANLWITVKFSNVSDIVTPEIISFASSEAIYVCLMNIGAGVPFISALELRPLNSLTYDSEYGKPASLLLFQRLNVGSTKISGRYNDDMYDRVWAPYVSPSWEAINTSLAVNTNENGYEAPPEVIQTAARPRNASEPLELRWTSSNASDQFLVYLYFAEVEQLQKNVSRKFNISWNGSQIFGPFSPRYLYSATISNSKALVGGEHRIVIYKTADSALPPILNAVEIYKVRLLDELLTNSEDVNALLSVKTTYQIKKNWAGDPCGPKKFPWEGLACNYSSSIPPQVIYLNLSSSRLNAAIAAAFAKLLSLESLDLSNNSLTGPVPEFLEELKNLKYLNLRGNNLSGAVPKALLERSNAGLLTLSVDEQNLCGSASCKRKKRIVIPVVSSVLSVMALFVTLVVLWQLRRKWKSGTVSTNEGGRYLASEKRHFTYPEVVSMTNNFQTVIGKGGFGDVYLGIMNEGIQVAVKMLSASSSQGPREFQTELLVHLQAELLMRIHHKNLVSFIGYCDESNNMVLIYEYLAKGNLKNYLSDCDSRTLSWESRLRIAMDAAQGLEYLHHGCKPPIVHRDVKTSNILLSESMEAKIADFGLSKVIPSDGLSHMTTSVVGTTGYLDPEYYISRKLNEKSDVYSFGIVLLELITGQPAIIKAEMAVHILEWASPFIQRGDILDLVDQRLRGDFDESSARRAVEIAMACAASTSLHRPTMSYVLPELKHCLEMELSRGLERTAGPRDEAISMTVSTSSPEILSTNFDSMSAISPR
ncbi:probable LRR receptor-like serine/threonine-protein kinase At4g29180 isoform X2 [Syzygium oleosum]|uniref:probable LRR receptor-like serine/threonine-protein kinase At4g29180 isoform X2 n=1 Tax=Syzygium oleosum TaxID=219896 RepID=UPI0024B9BEC1|nr:probable LRR receptor-like serine/threonine-protein kinase At4g29180 isoform X2 [Syzygium oleosum]